MQIRLAGFHGKFHKRAFFGAKQELTFAGQRVPVPCSTLVMPSHGLNLTHGKAKGKRLQCTTPNNVYNQLLGCELRMLVPLVTLVYLDNLALCIRN